MYTEKAIEGKARALLAEMERNAAAIWPTTPPSRLNMCDPVAACRHLGLLYLPESHLGTYGNTSTAGMLDRRSRAVMLSTRQSHEAQRFTAAHEIGHWLLHEDEILFRDRSLSDPRQAGRAPKERQADYFAACFLVPPKLLIHVFEALFQVRAPLSNTGAVCFNLSPVDSSYLEGLPPRSMEFALAVARAQSFNGRRFSKSMCGLFGVSPTTMAIRLQELELVS